MLFVGSFNVRIGGSAERPENKSASPVGKQSGREMANGIGGGAT